MKRWKPSRIERLSLYVLAPLLVPGAGATLAGSRYLSSPVEFLKISLVLCIAVTTIWYLMGLSIQLLRNRFPEFSQTRKRVAIIFLTHIVLSVTLTSMLCVLFRIVNLLQAGWSQRDFILFLLASLAATIITTTIWEGEYIFDKWKKSQEEKEQLEQLNLQNEFDSLKNQVNPHFLFNCFNTLSSLINEDEEQAARFLDELSKVYRYLLRNNEDGLTTLQQEMKFIESYFELLRTRHGDAIQVQFEVDRKYENYLLPSLSLQLLVENAVKHNMLSKAHPLVIDIFTTVGNKLVVNNNLQKRKAKVQSNKVGIDNIRTKYELLDQSGFQVVEDSRNFTVVLPLMWNVAGESRLGKNNLHLNQ